MYKEYARMLDPLISYTHIHDDRKNLFRGSYHYHVDRYEIMYIIGKDVKYILNNHEIDLEEHSVIVVPPMCIHTFKECLSEEGFEQYFVKINESLIPDSELVNLFKEGIVIKSEENSILHNIFKKLDLYHKELEKKEFIDIVPALMKEVLYNIKINKKSNDIAVIKPSSVNNILTDALSYIYDNYTSIKSMAEIANHLYISERSLNRVFQKYLSVGPKRMLMDRRLNEAKYLLERGAKPIDVYYLVGFTDYTVFYRNYKSRFGYPPTKQPKLITN